MYWVAHFCRRIALFAGRFFLDFHKLLFARLAGMRFRFSENIVAGAAGKISLLRRPARPLLSIAERAGWLRHPMSAP